MRQIKNSTIYKSDDGKFFQVSNETIIDDFEYFETGEEKYAYHPYAADTDLNYSKIEHENTHLEGFSTEQEVVDFIENLYNIKLEAIAWSR